MSLSVNKYVSKLFSSQISSDSPLPTLQLLETLLPLSDLDARVNKAVDLITSNHKNISHDLLHFAASTFYYKLKAADSYVPETKYHGSVTLLRAKTSSEYEQTLGADYKLSEVTYKYNCTHLQCFSIVSTISNFFLEL